MIHPGPSPTPNQSNREVKFPLRLLNLLHFHPLKKKKLL